MGRGHRSNHRDPSGSGRGSGNPHASHAAATNLAGDHARWGASAGSAAPGGGGGGGSSGRMSWSSSLLRGGRGDARIGASVGLGGKFSGDDQKPPGGGSKGWLNEADADLSDIKATMRRIDGACTWAARGFGDVFFLLWGPYLVGSVCGRSVLVVTHSKVLVPTCI